MSKQDDQSYMTLYSELLKDYFELLHNAKALVDRLVYCEEYKHYIAPGSIHFDDGTTNLGACSIVRAYMVEITPDGFCKWGERKTEDD